MEIRGQARPMRTEQNTKSNVWRQSVCWVVVTAILFSVPVPQTGLCFCEGCSCPRNVSRMSLKSNASMQTEMHGSCCSQKTPKPSCCRSTSKITKNRSARNGCTGRQSAEGLVATPNDSANRCRCGCDNEVPASALSTGRHRQKTDSENEQLELSDRPVSAFIRFSPTVTLIQSIDIFRLSWLPVRLHLLLLVLRN